MVSKKNVKIDTKEQILDEEKDKKVSFYEGIGRRREASARVRLYVVGENPISINGNAIGKGETLVNGKTVMKYFPGPVFEKLYQEPFRTTNTMNRFAVSAKISGGGLSGQLNAFIHGISRALEKIDKEKFRPILKKRGFLKRDPRAKERRKAGFAQKARARKQSPKR